MDKELNIDVRGTSKSCPSSDGSPMSFDLNKHAARLLMQEPFFAALSRTIEKRATTAVPTAGVRVNPHSAQFELVYNPEFMGSLPDNQKLGVLKHEFYHCIFGHVTNRTPEGGLTKLDNVAMDLSINSHLRGELPEMCCMPGEGPFADMPLGKSYEWYKAALEDKYSDESDSGDGESGDGEGEGDGGGAGDSGDGDGSGGGGLPDSFDDHGSFGEGDATTQQIAKERLKANVKKAAEEAQKARSWGTVSAECRKEIMDAITSKVDWKKVLRYFVKTSTRANKRSTVRRLNRRFPRIHAGKKVQRQARIGVYIDQSGSVDDGMLAKFYAELNKLANLAEFTVVPFDTEVAEDKIYVWKRGQSRTFERVLTGGTCFRSPTDHCNREGFDGMIVLTDLMAPKPQACKSQRMWMTTEYYAKHPYFKTSELIVAIPD